MFGTRGYLDNWVVLNNVFDEFMCWLNIWNICVLITMQEDNT